MNKLIRKWWKEAVVYQIYPKSFYDSDGDGMGDLEGIIFKLDYLKSLGIDVIWLCPIYKSPNDDNGYDISDYYSIAEEYGGMKSFERLVEEIHKRGMKMIMDLVINHTSDEHPWFLEAKSSKENEYRDYYIWKQGEQGKEPNNWRSYFTSSVWTFDDTTKEYFLHLFSKKQPDLNWKNDKVKKDIFKMMRWWLDKGIDGFRMDVINHLCKAEGYPDSAKMPSTSDGYVFDDDLYANQNGIHEVLKQMNEDVLSNYDIMTVGETPNVTPEIGEMYVREDRKELNMIFQFELMGIDCGKDGKWDVIPWKLSAFKEIISKWQYKMDGNGWNSLYLNNHDQPRLVSRFGNDKELRIESAKMLATMTFTLQGTPFVYQGEEIGMTNTSFEDIKDYRDIETINVYNQMLQAGNLNGKEIMELINLRGRDNARTPMQWNRDLNAGFTLGEPWIRVNPNYSHINVKDSLPDENSILNYYRNLIQLRKYNLVLVYGHYSEYDSQNQSVFCYSRYWEQEQILVILNFKPEQIEYKLPDEIDRKRANLLITNYKEIGVWGIKLVLRPFEARVYKLED